MKCVLSPVTIFITILFTLKNPIGIVCCSTSQNEILVLMRTDPYYQWNPCYIQWKAYQDAEMQQLLKQKEQSYNSFSAEKSVGDNIQIALENRLRDQAFDEAQRKEREDRQKSVKVEYKGITQMLIVIIGGIVGIFCCAACIAFAKKKLKTTVQPTTNTLRSNHSFDGFNSVSTRPAANMNLNQTASNYFSTTNTNNNINMIGTEDRTSSIRGSNVPLLSQAVVNRQTSLPSYNDAVKIPSAPPEE